MWIKVRSLMKYMTYEYVFVRRIMETKLVRIYCIVSSGASLVLMIIPKFLTAVRFVAVYNDHLKWSILIFKAKSVRKLINFE